MPFSFKPTQEGEIPQQTVPLQETAQVPSSSSYFSFATRADGEHRGFVQILLFIVFGIIKLLTNP